MSQIPEKFHPLSYTPFQADYKQSGNDGKLYYKYYETPWRCIWVSQ